MAELELDVPHARTLAKELGRHGVAKGVWVDPPFDPHLRGEPLEQRPDVGRLERLAPERAEEGSPAVQAEDCAPVGHPLLHEGEALGIEPHGPVAGLPVRNAERPRRRVEVGRPEGKRLAHAEAGAPENHEKGAVPQPGGV